MGNRIEPRDREAGKDQRHILLSLVLRLHPRFRNMLLFLFGNRETVSLFNPVLRQILPLLYSHPHHLRSLSLLMLMLLIRIPLSGCIIIMPSHTHKSLLALIIWMRVLLHRPTGSTLCSASCHSLVIRGLRLCLDLLLCSLSSVCPFLIWRNLHKKEAH